MMKSPQRPAAILRMRADAAPPRFLPLPLPPARWGRGAAAPRPRPQTTTAASMPPRLLKPYTTTAGPTGE